MVFSQIVASEPALAAGAEIRVSSIELAVVCDTQGAIPAHVNVSVTLPLVISTELGVYIGDKDPDAGENDPVPEVVHTMVELNWAVAPTTGKVAPEHIVALGPA